MRNFNVIAVNGKGQQIKELVAAEDTLKLTQIIKERGLYLVEYKELESTTVSVTKLKLRDLVIFCKQLGTMLHAGIPIVQSLHMVQGKAGDRKTKQIYSSIYEEVQKGNSLSAAMLAQEGAFPKLLINMVEAGELGGTLDKSLTQMAQYFEKENKLNNKVKSATTYPIILGIVATGVVLMLVTFVLPTITSMFDPSMMPLPTKIVMGFSNFITSNWLLIILVLGLLVLGFNMLAKVPSVKYTLDKSLLNLPVIGPLNRTIYSARAARSMASLYSSGIQTLDMLETTGKVLSNVYLEDQFNNVMMEVSKGGLISTAIEQTNSFDPMLSSMIYIGEESGSLEEILDSTADYFDEEADAATGKLVSMLEPIMIVVLAIIIGFIIIAIMMPIFTMYESAGA